MKSSGCIMILACLILSFGMLAIGYTKNLGNYGQVFPVIEEDLRQLIMHRLRQIDSSGELMYHQHEIVKKVSEHIIRPTPLNLHSTTRPKIFYIDPTVVVNQDVMTPDGILVAKSGTKLNPFEYVTFHKTLFFFDGDDKHQVAWVRTHYQDYSHVKFILTGGDIRESAEQFGRIYFDFGGRLTRQLNITHVPSVASQDGRIWKIQEIGVHDA